MGNLYTASRIVTVVIILLPTLFVSWWFVVALPLALAFNEAGIRRCEKYERENL